MNKLAAKVLVLCVTLSVFATACGSGSDADSGSSKTFDVVFVGGKSGDTAALYADLARAIGLAVDDLNKDGGIDGRKLKLEELDSQADPAKAVTVMQSRLSSGAKPGLVFAGAANSGEPMSVAPVLARQDIPVTGLGGSPLLDDAKTYPLVRSMSALHTDQLKSTRAQLEAANVTSLVAMLPQGAYGDGLKAAFAADFKDSPMKITIQEYDAEGLDQTSAVQRAEDAKSDAIFFDCIADQCPRILDARTKVNGAIDTPFFAGLGFSQVTPPAEMGVPAALKNLKFQVFQSQVIGTELGQNPAFKSFYDRYKAGADGKVKTVVLAALAYNAVRMWAKAAEQSHSTSGAKMAAEFAPGLKVDDDFWLGVTPPTFPEGHTISTYPPDNFTFIPGNSPVKDGLFEPAS